MRRRPPPILPDHWTPKQALAAFELLDFIRDQLWEQYRQDIQRAMRADRVTTADPRQLPIPLDGEPPF
jgi:hypothetical protein